MKKSRFSDSQILSILKQAENAEIADWPVRLTHTQKEFLQRPIGPGSDDEGF